MTALRHILDDLIEKKLWPIAVALVAALIALPLVFGGGGSEDVAAPPAPVTSEPVAGASAAAVSIQPDPAVDKRTRKGDVRNPFKQLAKADEVTTDSAPGTPATGGTAPSSGGLPTVSAPPSPPAPSGGSAPSTGGGSAPAAPVKRKPAAPKGDAGRADVVFRFARRGKDAKRFEDPSKLAGIPTAAYPLLVFSGVRSDGKALRFVVNPLVRVTGDGRCRPSRDRCRTLEVRPGGTALVDVLDSPTKVVHYRLDVVRASR